MLKQMINKAEEGIISLLLVSMTLLVVFEVVLRFGFGTGYMWSQELTMHISAWFVLFGASYGLKVGAHIGVDAFVHLFSIGWQRVLSAVAVIFCLAYCGLFLYGGWVYLAKMRQIGIDLEDLPIPTWIAQSILVIGMALLSLRLLQLLWGIIKGTHSGFKHHGEAEESLELAEGLAAEKGDR